MANFDQLKQSVAALIRTNGAEEITGQIMQDVLLTIINSISGGYMFGGVAQHNGNVGNPDYNVFYLAGSGAYTGYGDAINIPNGCYGVFRYNGSWTQDVVDIGVHLTGTIREGETNGVTGDVINTALQQLFNNVMNILDTLTFTYNTPSAQQATKAMLDVIMTPTGGASHVLTTLTLVSATAAAAGLMSAEDKQKVDRMLTDFRSLSFSDTTAVADQATKIVQTLSATLGENPEVITTMTFLAATASKAGLLSAADKAKLDALWSSGYQFAGIATPSTTPVSTTSKIFYIATEAGTYFNAVTVTQGINILSWNGSAWSAVQVIGIDDEPTAGSHNLVGSGDIYKVLNRTAESGGYVMAINTQSREITIADTIYIVNNGETYHFDVTNNVLNYTLPSSGRSFYDVCVLNDNTCTIYNVFTSTYGDVKEVLVRFNVDPSGIVSVSYSCCLFILDGEKCDLASLHYSIEKNKIDINHNEIYEEGFSYFNRTTPVKWNNTYKISRFLKVTNDVDIEDVTTPTQNAACCVMYDKDYNVIGSKVIQSETYGAYGNIDASDLEGAVFFRICGNMNRPPVFNYVPVFAIDYSEEEYLDSEQSIGCDVGSAEGNYQSYGNNLFNHYDEAHNMEVIGIKAKFHNASNDIDILLFDAVTKMSHVIQTIPKEMLKVGSYAYTYIRLNKPVILKANQYIGFSQYVFWKNIPKSTEGTPTVNTIGGSTIGNANSGYTDVSVAVFDYYLFVRQVNKYRFDKKLSVITDSIGTSAYVTNPNRVYWKALANHTGMTVLGTSTIGGSSITPGLKSDGIKPFVDQSRIDALSVNGVNPDLIIIEGGVNDFNSISADGQHPCPIGSWSDDPSDPSLSFYASTRCLLSRLKTAYPQANIIFCTPPKMFASGKLISFEPLTNKENVKMSQFVDVIKDVSKEYGALCVDLFAELPITHENYQTYMVDTYHANDKGCALIEDLLLNKMIALYGYM